jgi:hypothetical protein
MDKTSVATKELIEAMRIFAVIGFLMSVVMTGQVLCQGRAMTRDEFDGISRRGYDNLAKFAHRQKTSDQRSDLRDGDIISQVIEKESPTRWKNVSLLKTTTGTRQHQIVRVDGRELQKNGNEPWTEPERDGNRFTMLGDRAEVTKTESFRSVGTEKIGGEELRIVESVTTYVFRTADQTRSSEHLERYWVDKSGRFKKEEVKSIQNGKVFWHSISTYEYDPTIRVKLPIQPKKY